MTPKLTVDFFHDVICDLWLVLCVIAPFATVGERAKSGCSSPCLCSVGQLRKHGSVIWFYDTGKGRYFRTLAAMRHC